MIVVINIVILLVNIFLLACMLVIYIKQAKMIQAFFHNTQPLSNLVFKYSNKDTFDKLKNSLSKYEKENI